MRRFRLNLQAGLKGAGHSCTLRVLEPTLPKSQKKRGARGSLLSSPLSENGRQLHHAAHARVVSGGWPCRFRWCQARVLISVLAALLFRSLNLRSLDRLAICSPFQVGQQTGTICGNRKPAQAYLLSYAKPWDLVLLVSVWPLRRNCICPLVVVGGLLPGGFKGRNKAGRLLPSPLKITNVVPGPSPSTERRACNFPPASGAWTQILRLDCSGSGICPKTIRRFGGSGTKFIRFCHTGSLQVTLSMLQV